MGTACAKAQRRETARCVCAGNSTEPGTTGAARPSVQKFLPPLTENRKAGPGWDREGGEELGRRHLYLPKEERDNRALHLCPPQRHCRVLSALLPTLQGPSLQILRVTMPSLPFELSAPRGQGLPGRSPHRAGREAPGPPLPGQVLARRISPSPPHCLVHLRRRHSGPCALWRVECSTAQSSPGHPGDRGSSVQTLLGDEARLTRSGPRN